MKSRFRWGALQLFFTSLESGGYFALVFGLCRDCVFCLCKHVGYERLAELYPEVIFSWFLPSELLTWHRELYVVTCFLHIGGAVDDTHGEEAVPWHLSAGRL